MHYREAGMGLVNATGSAFLPSKVVLLVGYGSEKATGRGWKLGDLTFCCSIFHCGQCCSTLRAQDYCSMKKRSPGLFIHLFLHSLRKAETWIEGHGPFLSFGRSAQTRTLSNNRAPCIVPRRFCATSGQPSRLCSCQGPP